MSLIQLRDRFYAMPYTLLIITNLAWAGNTVLARGVVDMFPPISLAFWRWLVAAVILFPFARSYLRRDWAEIKSSWRILTFISIAGVSCYNTFLYIGVQTTTAINSGLILSTGPAAIVLLSLLMLRQRIGPIQTAGLLLSFIGAALIIAHGNLNAILELKFVKGDLWVIGSVISGAFFAVLLHMRPAIHPVSLVITTFVIGLVLLFPLYVWELGYSQPIKIDAAVVSSILYVATAPSIISFFCWNRGIELVGPNRAGLFLYLTPVFVSLMAWFFLDEVLHWFHYAGMILIFAGMLLFHRRSEAKTA
jgi:drug/metabolite transporter (DMT)-like permease